MDRGAQVEEQSAMRQSRAQAQREMEQIAARVRDRAWQKQAKEQIYAMLGICTACNEPMRKFPGDVRVRCPKCKSVLGSATHVRKARRAFWAATMASSPNPPGKSILRAINARTGHPTECIGVDLDGTLAHYTKWMGPLVIGKPIPAMVEKVKQALADGKKVVIFTARVNNDRDGSIAAFISAWCKRYIGQALSVTHEKSPEMTEIWDDRARRVKRNKGVFADGTIIWDSPQEPMGADWLEVFNNIMALPSDHPPSLKNPIPVPIPNNRDGWEPGASKEARKQALRDLKITVQDILMRQIGKPCVYQTITNPWYPFDGGW